MPVLLVGNHMMRQDDAGRHADGVSPAVVEALAAATDTDPLAMSPPLNHVIDADALNALFDHESPPEVTFEYNEETVVVSDDGTVSVDGAVYDGDDSGGQR